MDEISIVPSQIKQASSTHVAIDLSVRTKGASSGIETASQGASLLVELDGGLMRSITFFESMDAALAAA